MVRHPIDSPVVDVVVFLSDPEQAELLVKRMQILNESSDHAQLLSHQILSQQLSRAFDADLSLARILQFFEASDDHDLCQLLRTRCIICFAAANGDEEPLRTGSLQILKRLAGSSKPR